MPISYALFERNAKACEHAKHPKCVCVCGGALHGRSHAAAMDALWVRFKELTTGQGELLPAHCPECGQPDCPWWNHRRVHELATAMMIQGERALELCDAPNCTEKHP